MASRPFVPAANVPIVGLPLEVLGYTIMVPVRCRCTAGGYLTLFLTQDHRGRNASVTTCASCGRAMHLQSVTLDAQGSLSFSIEVGDVPPSPGPLAS